MNYKEIKYMKYYSDKLDKLFDTKEQLFKEEKMYDDKLAFEKAQLEAKEVQLKAEAEAEQKATSKRKKELSDEVEKATKHLDEAYKFYEAERAKAKDIYSEAQKKADEILKKAKKEADELIDIAEKEVKKASEKKTLAISEFNKEFGPYKTVITGDKAIDEYNKMIRNIDNTFAKFWDSFFRW